MTEAHGFSNPANYEKLRTVVREISNNHEVATAVMQAINEASGAKEKNPEEVAVEIKEVLRTLVASFNELEYQDSLKEAPEETVENVKPAYWSPWCYNGAHRKRWNNDNNMEVAIEVPGVRGEDVIVNVTQVNDKYFVVEITTSGELDYKNVREITVHSSFDHTSITENVENGLLILGFVSNDKSGQRTVPVA